MRAVLLLLVLALPAAAADLGGLDWDQHPGASLPFDAPLTGGDGRATSLRRAAAGLPLILAPGYFRCPNLCGIVRDDLFAALASSGLRPGRDVAVALVTIDPAETADDAAAAVAGILDRYPGLVLHALTGPAASLDAIAAAAGFRARFDPASRQFLHPAGVVLATASGLVSGYALGVGYAPAALAEAVAAAREGRFAAAEPIRLFCFSYDPITGRFSLAVMEALRLGAVATVLGIGVAIARLARRA